MTSKPWASITCCARTHRTWRRTHTAKLSLAAAATDTLHLGTGVTNPITRDAAVTATAIMTLQQESAGRAICAIGRGDSSAAHIGTRNATTAQLRTYVERIKAYMAGETIDRDGTESKLRWVQEQDACAGARRYRVHGPEDDPDGGRGRRPHQLRGRQRAGAHRKTPKNNPESCRIPVGDPKSAPRVAGFPGRLRIPG